MISSFLRNLSKQLPQRGPKEQQRLNATILPLALEPLEDRLVPSGGYGTQVLLDSGPGFTETGNWVYTPTGPEGGVYHTNPGAGDGNSVAQWKTAVAPGRYEVWATWISGKADSTRAPYTILDDNKSLATVRVNQKTDPVGYQDGPFTWQSLGIFTFQTDTLTVQLTNAVKKEVVADAIRIVPVDPQIQVFDGASAVPLGGSVYFGITFGEPMTKTFTVTNSGSEALTLGAVSIPPGFHLGGSLFNSETGSFRKLAPGASSDFTMTLDAGTSGNYGGTLSFTTNDPTAPTFQFTLSSGVNPLDVRPHVQVAGGTAGITNGGQYNFGTTTVGEPLTRTFTVTNSGSQNLTVGAVSIPAGFTLTAPLPSTTIAPGASRTFTVRLNAASQGTYSGVLSFATNDPEAPTFHFTISGTVNLVVAPPRIQVAGGTAGITNGGQYNFGTTTVGQSLTRTFTVINNGGQNLTLGAVSVPAGFTLTTSLPSTTIAPGASATFTVRLDAASPSNYSGVLSFITNDPAAPLFRFTVTGTVNGVVTVPLVQVFDGNAALTNGGQDNFGITTVGQPLTRTFTVTNSGGQNLTLGVVSVPSGFTLTTPPSTTIAPGASITFTVRLDAAALGNYSGLLSFTTNDPAAATFGFTVTGMVNTVVTGPQVQVLDGNAAVTNGGQDNFGTTTIGDPLTKTFTVTNSGNENLILGAVTIPSGFTLTAPITSTTLAPGASTTFTVRLNAATLGTYSGTLSFMTNDLAALTFSFSISGTVNAVGAPSASIISPSSVQQGQTIALQTYGYSDSQAVIDAGFTYVWHFGDGSIASGQYTTHIYASPGTYTVTVTVTDHYNNTGNAVTTVSVVSPTNDPLFKQVLGESNFSYLGSFYLPLQANGYSSSGSSGGLAYRYVNGQLRFFTTSHVYSGGVVYEVADPGYSINPQTGDYPWAPLVNEWGDIYTGHKWVENEGGISNLGAGVTTNGLYYDQTLNRLYWNYGHWYNYDNPNNPSVGYSVLNDNTVTGTGVGAWSLTNRYEKFDRGGITRIPQWFADRFTNGMTLGVGFGGYYSIINSGSLGPALAAIADPNINTNPDRSSVPHVPLLGYPPDVSNGAHRNPYYTTGYDDRQPQNGTGYWTWSDMIGGGTWIDTPSLHGVLFIGQIGQGHVWYEGSDRHAAGGEYEWLVYDPKDLAAVASGAKQQWQIQPVAEWTTASLPVSPQDQYGFSGTGQGGIGGITFDPTTNRLYVLASAVWNKGYEWMPQVYVYQLTGNPLIPIAGSSFETPSVGIGVNALGGTPWVFTGSSGVAGNAPDGTQVAFLQGLSSFSQAVSFGAGTYTLHFEAAQGAGNFSSQTVQVAVDGTVVGTFTPGSMNYASFATDSFTVTAGLHTLHFVGLDPNGQDDMMLMDQFQLFS